VQSIARKSKKHIEYKRRHGPSFTVNVLSELRRAVPSELFRAVYWCEDRFFSGK